MPRRTFARSLPRADASTLRSSTSLEVEVSEWRNESIAICLASSCVSNVISASCNGQSVFYRAYYFRVTLLSEMYVVKIMRVRRCWPIGNLLLDAYLTTLLDALGHFGASWIVCYSAMILSRPFEDFTATQDPPTHLSPKGHGATKIALWHIGRLGI